MILPLHRVSEITIHFTVMLEEEDGWAHNRVFSPESAARAWEAPGAPAPDGALARAIAEAEATADGIVRSIVDRYGKKE